MKRLFALFLVLVLIGCKPAEVEEEEGLPADLAAEIERIHNTPINDVDLSLVEDGSYEGKFGYQGVDYGVKVTVKDRRIESIEVTQTEDDEYAKMAEAVLDRVIEEQKITVDATTGATTTSLAFLKAVELALTGR